MGVEAVRNEQFIHKWRLIHRRGRPIKASSTHNPTIQTAIKRSFLFFVFEKTAMSMGLPRSMVCMFLPLAVLLFVTHQHAAHALMPYRSIWDIMQPAIMQGGFSEDPFRILEQSPLGVPRSAVDTVAIARTDWKETSGEHMIWMDIPGVKKEDLKIEVEENSVLRISGEMKGESEVEGERWHRAERSSSGRFWRQFRLPGNANMEGIKAHLENGVLKVTVPKLPEEKKKEAKVVKIEEGSMSGGEDVKPSRADV